MVKLMKVVTEWSELFYGPGEAVDVEGEVSEVSLHEWKPEGIVVSLDEEYGFRHWMWRPGCSEDDMKRAWQEYVNSLSHGDGDGSGKLADVLDLPGEIMEVHLIPGGYVAFYKDEPIYFVPQGTPTWRAHLHMADDSWLDRADEE